MNICIYFLFRRDKRGVEFEANWEVQMKAVLPWLVCWARRAGTRDFYHALAALVNTLQNIFNSMCPQ
jgi:hypothetical protein